jgi:hypothetical protein
MKKTNIAEVALTDEEDWGLFLLLLLPNSLQSLEDQLAELGRSTCSRSAWKINLQYFSLEEEELADQLSFRF